ncbi:hypothetical protein [Eleftheria terrae]|uniref:hypothetical protein n=1 Tax=Eleftheria terrae TaxID=1597781 RepID=UPI00263B933F|nr:hypothetical protein [Eleftheria terrae]WKB55313.1 hypothetical protein N7L95_24825 [Eleftheria terrae]
MRRRDQDTTDPTDPDDRPPVIHVPSPPAPVPPSPPPPTVAHGDVMWAEQYLPPGASLTSANGRYSLAYESDGHLVLYKHYPYHGRKGLWDPLRPLSIIPRIPVSAGRCFMQGDGNLVVSGADGSHVWDSATGAPGSRLVLQDDGNLVLYRPDGVAVWASNTVQGPLPPTGRTPQGDTLRPEDALHPDGAITSADGRFSLVFQGDGNLVLYRNRIGQDRTALWSSGTHGKAAEVCLMQGDGNLVIYGPDGEPVWDSATHGHPGARLVLQNDGNLVLYDGDAAVWATDTPRLEYFRKWEGNDGWLSVTLRPDGSVRFQGHEHGEGQSVDFRIVAHLTYGDTYQGGQTVLALPKSGHLGAKILSSSPRDVKWDETTHSEDVRRDFEEIERAARFDVAHERDGRITGLLEDAFDTMVKWTIGTVLFSTGIGKVVFLVTQLVAWPLTGSFSSGLRMIGGYLWLAGPNGTLYALLADGLARLGERQRLLTSADDPDRAGQPGEYEWAQAIFKGTLPARDRMVVTDTTGGRGAKFVFPGPGGKIYINLTDKWFERNTLMDQKPALLVHELVHAWQIEHNASNGAWLMDALWTQTIHGTGGYEINLEELRPWGDYNLEQQAEIVEKWYVGTLADALPEDKATSDRLLPYMLEHIWVGRA